MLPPSTYCVPLRAITTVFGLTRGKRLQSIQKLLRRHEGQAYKLLDIQLAVPESERWGKPIIGLRAERHQIVQETADVPGFGVTEIVKAVSQIGMPAVAVQWTRHRVLPEKSATGLVMEAIIQAVHDHALRRL
jgi:hypothetical protein